MLSQLHLQESGSSVCDLVSNMQFFVHTQELYTLQVTGQELLAQIKAHVASLESVAPGDQVLLLTGTSLEDEATLGQCGVKLRAL